ncbi:glycosyltransferase family protein [Shimia abyssi]|uniref:Putative glycosyltransferase n=1 Tax=Shimia abyssi TaxID=1662395 RepID=A0A2P8FAK8_9RHOB|nr:glycosyltransferase [Shimia abyssi]PSL18755.1 putative glycosyltransferase [Shimia abyssi]
MKVMIAVTHLLGAGHLSRAATLARAFAHSGHEVSLLSGGRAAPHLDMSGFSLLQAPPLASDGINFARLLDDTGGLAEESYLKRRTDRMVRALQETAPDVLITELFPFGRRALSGEFLALLEAAKSLPTKPRVYASIRDILAPPSKPSKADRAEEILSTYYDGVLVHSDPAITPLDASWPVSSAVADMLNYTGYVAPHPVYANRDGDGAGEVIVSAGGGSVGNALFECAIQAAEQSDLTWRLLVGGEDKVERINKLNSKILTENVIVESVRPDFRDMLARAAASVSMCGYNTALDLLQTGLPGVIIPFDDGGEVEQTLRAESLRALPSIEVITSSDLYPERLAVALTHVLTSGHRVTDGLKMDGAGQSVRIVERDVHGLSS